MMRLRATIVAVEKQKKKKFILRSKYLFLISLRFLSETFLIQRRIQRDIIKIFLLVFV